MLSPQPTYDDFRTETEVLEKLAATLIHGTETIRDQHHSAHPRRGGGRARSRARRCSGGQSHRAGAGGEFRRAA